MFSWESAWSQWAEWLPSMLFPVLCMVGCVAGQWEFGLWGVSTSGGRTSLPLHSALLWDQGVSGMSSLISTAPIAVSAWSTCPQRLAFLSHQPPPLSIHKTSWLISFVDGQHVPAPAEICVHLVAFPWIKALCPSPRSLRSRSSSDLCC